MATPPSTASAPSFPFVPSPFSSSTLSACLFPLKKRGVLPFRRWFFNIDYYEFSDIILSDVLYVYLIVCIKEFFIQEFQDLEISKTPSLIKKFEVCKLYGPSNIKFSYLLRF